MSLILSIFVIHFWHPSRRSRSRTFRWIPIAIGIWQGAATGLIVSGLNHWVHMNQVNKAYKKFINNKFYGDEEGLKQYTAIVVSESTNDVLEAQGIGEVILRRLEDQGAILEVGFVDKIGGAGQYDAIGKGAYNEIMKMDMVDVFRMSAFPSYKYATRILGSMNALINYSSNITQGAFFWNASLPQKGFNWDMVKNGTFLQTTSIGGTTFFKYSNLNTTWP